jgi:hypothetical protein
MISSTFNNNFNFLFQLITLRNIISKTKSFNHFKFHILPLISVITLTGKL